jgi:hypothetical protein
MYGEGFTAVEWNVFFWSLNILSEISFKSKLNDYDLKKIQLYENKDILECISNRRIFNNLPFAFLFIQMK